MTIDFHSKDNRLTYSKREADLTWINKIKDICEVEGSKVLDMGCGGGIYSRALVDLGATTVTGLDFSNQQLSAAEANSKEYPSLRFYFGNVLDTGLESEQYDIVLNRAVIHHVKDLDKFLKEIFRLLKPGGQCLIQDRTPDDCLLKGSSTHIRGYFFSKYPELADQEISRRHTSEKVVQVLQSAGFKDSKEYKLWETRKTYESLDDLVTDILNRTGRSILHEISNEQLENLAMHIREQLKFKDNESIDEKDRWTIWKAVK